MTYWYDARETHKDRTFWIRVSVTLAQDLGLDLNLESCHTKQQRMLKRLWWCCLMRDQFVALMMWTPPQLGARHRHLPMLELEDFELQELPPSMSHLSRDWDFISDRKSRVQLAMLCIAKARLSVCINQILQAWYSSLRYESRNQMTTILIPKRPTANAFEVLELDRQLREWYYSLSETGKIDFRDPLESVFGQAPDVISIHRAQLKLLFLSTMIALHRPQALDTAGSLPPTYLQLSRTKLYDAAEEVAHVALSIRNLEMGTHLSPRGVTLLLPIMLAHLQDVRPIVNHPRRSRLDKYHDCMQSLDTIGEMGGSEDFFPSKLEAAFLHFNILPSYEYSVPPTITFPGLSHDSSVIAGAGVFPHLSQLGAMTESEMRLLEEMSFGRRRTSTPPSRGYLDDRQYSDLQQSSNGVGSSAREIENSQHPLKSQTLSAISPPSCDSPLRTVDPKQMYLPPTQADSIGRTSEQAHTPTALEDEEAAIESFFRWRIERTKLPLQRHIVENAHQTVLCQMWTLDDLKTMENVKSDLYKLAIQQGIPDGLARSFRRELAIFMSQG